MQAGFFTTWPGLTTELVEKHIDKSPAIVKVHLRQIYQNIRSTKTANKILSLPSKPVMTIPSHEKFRANIVSIKIVEIEGKVFTDRRGRFPVASNKGNKYSMVLFDNDSNTILATPMKSRSQEKIVRVQEFLHDSLTMRGFKPQIQI